MINYKKIHKSNIILEKYCGKLPTKISGVHYFKNVMGRGRKLEILFAQLNSNYKSTVAHTTM